jgi:adenylate kinase
MRLVLVGPPGSGKGTQAENLVKQFNLTYIGTGAMLRDAMAHGTEMGRQIKPLMDKGLLVPDAIVNDVVAELFRGPNRPDCFVMDGYPRTYSQAVAFDALLIQQFLSLDAVINLTISDDEVVRRIGGRRVCPNPDCGASYNVFFRPPAVPGKCDKCKTALVLREDDQEDTIRRRLREFHNNTEHLLRHYRERNLLRDVPATDPVGTIYANILKALGHGETGGK